VVVCLGLDLRCVAVWQVGCDGCWRLLLFESFHWRHKWPDGGGPAFVGVNIGVLQD
jgi:hypothetical protein